MEQREEQGLPGRITIAQARANTMLQRKANETTTEEHRPDTQPLECEEEEEFFLAQELPSMNDCA